jgi:hypothetical protein
MLGPALTLLFNQLDRRTDKQTLYEKRLHQELLALKTVGEKLRESPSSGAHGLPTDLSVSGLSDFARSRFGMTLDSHLTSVIVGPQEDDEAARLQINCGKPNCPNKEYK